MNVNDIEHAFNDRVSVCCKHMGRLYRFNEISGIIRRRLVSGDVRLFLELKDRQGNSVSVVPAEEVMIDSTGEEERENRCCICTRAIVIGEEIPVGDGKGSVCCYHCHTNIVKEEKNNEDKRNN